MRFKGFVFLVTVLAATGLVSAQFCPPSIACCAFSTPYQTRATGYTEVIGDFLLRVNRVIPVGATFLFTLPTTITNEPRCPALEGAECVIQANMLLIRFNRTLDPPTDIRLRGIRADVSALGSGAGEAISDAPPRIDALFDLSNICDGAVPVGAIISPLELTAGPPLRFEQCRGGRDRFCVQVREGAPNVFTTIGQETALSDTPPPSNGAQIRIVFNDVPHGTRITAPTSVDGGSLGLELISEASRRGPGLVDFLYEVSRADLGMVETAEVCFTIDVPATHRHHGRGRSTVQAQLYPEPGPIVSFRHPLQNDPPDEAFAVVRCTN